MLKIIKKIKFIYIFWFFFYWLLLMVLIRGGFSQLDPDFGWHLKVGQEIAINRQIPQINTFNYTYTGNWVDHEWLSNLGLYYIFNNFGYNALVFFFAGLIGLVLIILNIFVYKTLPHRPFWLIAVVQLFGVLAAIPHFGVRIQELALLFVLLILIIIEWYSRLKDWRILLALPPLFFLWANLHASFLLGFFILFSWLAVKLFEYWLAGNKKLNWLVVDYFLKLKLLGIFFIFALLSWAVTWLTPYRADLYSFLFGYKNKAYLSLIQEWLPQYSFPFYYNQLLYLALGAAAFLLYIYFQVKAKKALDFWRLFLVFVFLGLSFQSRRHFPLFFIVSFSLIIETYSQFFLGFKLVYYYWLKRLVLACLILIIIAQFLAISPATKPFSFFCADYPCRAVDFLKNNPQYDDFNIFNNYGWGGFLIWVLPERKLFIDGRLPQIEFAGWTFIQEYFDFFGMNNKPQDKLNQYNIKLVLIAAEDRPIRIKNWEKIFFRIKDQEIIPNNRLRKYLDSASDWQVIYQDETAKIYFRN